MVFWPIYDPKIGFLRFYPGKLRVITSKPLLMDSTVKNTSRKVYLESLAYRAENARKSFYYPNPYEKLGQLPYTGISRDRDSFSPISRQGSILTLCHGGLFGISVRKYIELSCFQQSGALLEQIQRSTVERFSTLSPFPHALALCSKN